MQFQQTLTTQSVIASILLEESHLQEEELINKMSTLYTAIVQLWTTSTPKMMHPRNSTKIGSSSRQEPRDEPSIRGKGKSASIARSEAILLTSVGRRSKISLLHILQ